MKQKRKQERGATATTIILAAATAFGDGYKSGTQRYCFGMKSGSEHGIFSSASKGEKLYLDVDEVLLNCGVPSSRSWRRTTRPSDVVLKAASRAPCHRATPRIRRRCAWARARRRPCRWPVAGDAVERKADYTASNSQPEASRTARDRSPSSSTPAGRPVARVSKISRLGARDATTAKELAEVDETELHRQAVRLAVAGERPAALMGGLGR
jgi:hypothetical protein